MDIEELRNGNLEFMIIAATKMAFDKTGSLNRTFRSAMRGYSRERWDGLQELQPSAGYLFIDWKDALPLLEQLNEDSTLINKFQRELESNLSSTKNYVLDNQGASIKVPFEGPNIKFSIGLKIIGYTWGESPFWPVGNPLDLKKSIYLERLADIVFYKE